MRNTFINLPWIETELEQICSKPQYGYTTKSATSGKIKFLRTSDITKKLLDWDTVPYCETEPLDTLKYQLEDRDIVISRAGSVGFSCLLKDVPNPSVFASYLIRFKPSTYISEDYLKRFLESEGYWSQLALMSAGNAVQNVNAKNLSKIRLPLAPLHEQKVIAEKLDIMLSQVENIKTRLENIPNILKMFRQSVLAAAVSGKLTDGNQIAWNSQKLKDLVTKIGSGSTPKGGKSVYKESGIPLIRSLNIHTYFIKYEDLAFITNEQANKLANVEIQKNDVLLNITGASIGRVNITPNDFVGGRVNQHVAIIRCIPDKLIPKYLHLYLASPYIQKWIDNENYGATRQALTKEMIEQIDINRPPIEEQMKIVNRVEELFTLAENLEYKANTALNRVNNLNQSILAKAFRGELTEEWRAKNPELISGENSAEALLLKIEAEREALKLENKPKNKTIRNTKKKSVYHNSSDNLILNFIDKKGMAKPQEIFDSLKEQMKLQEILDEISKLLDLDMIKAISKDDEQYLEIKL